MNRKQKRATRGDTVYKRKRNLFGGADAETDAGTSSEEAVAPLVDDNLLVGSDEIRQMEGFRTAKYRKILYFLLCITLIGYLIMRKWKWLRATVLFDRCSLSEANRLLVTGIDGKQVILKVKSLIIFEDVYTNPSVIIQNDEPLSSNRVEYRMFEFQHLRYVYDSSLDSFVVQSKSTRSHTGLDSCSHRKRLAQFGANVIDVKTGKKLKLFITELFFAIFWFIKSYVGYGVIVLMITGFSVYISFRQKNQSLSNLKELAKSYAKEIRVIRDGESFMAGSAGLVPGDLIAFTGRVTLPCDMVLLTGSCNVDESTITGVMVPAVKIPYQADLQKFGEKHPVMSDNKLIGGTRVLSAKSTNDLPVIAVVTHTGFNTTKGKIIRSVLLAHLQSKEHPYIKDVDNYAILMILCGVISLLMSLLYFCIFPEMVDTRMRWTHTLDLLLISLPAFLQLSYSWPMVIANMRLKLAGIQAINLLGFMKFGSLDCICYDKTGTLTEDTLGLYGALEVNENTRSFLSNVKQNLDEMSPDSINCMAACHNLTKVNDKVTGDILEEEIFHFTGYELKREKADNRFIVHPPPALNERGITQVTSIFPFSPTLRRMSVITRFPTFSVYCKGFPDSVRRICNPQTVPADYDDKIKYYGLKGYRILAMARKPLSEELFFQQMSRDEIECGMIFCGFLIMQNRLRSETETELAKLRNTKIRTPMITGDTIFTAIAVSKQCDIINPFARMMIATVSQDPNNDPMVLWKDISDNSAEASDNNTELAIDGSAFALLRSYTTDRQKLMYQKLLVRCNVYAEMLPGQKAELINDLQEMDYIVGMCGDGANDSLALSAADVSLSISDVETSFAAQFSSETKHCMAKLIMDSRAMLDKIFHSFKFIAIFVLLQIGVALLNNVKLYAQPQMIWTNAIKAFLLVLAISFANPIDRIDKQRPPTSIIRAPVILSILGQVVIQLLFLAGVTRYITAREWFKEYQNLPGSAHDDLVTCFSFLYSNFQYLTVALSQSFSFKYVSRFRNIIFFLLIGGFLIVDFIMLWPFPRTNGRAFAGFNMPKSFWLSLNMDITVVYNKQFEEEFMYDRAAAFGFFIVNSICTFIFEIVLRFTFKLLYIARDQKPASSFLKYRRLAAQIPSLCAKNKLN